jgi:hypothetical protein
MDLTQLFERVKGILLTPDKAWDVIAQESTTIVDLYKNYIVILAAIPAVFGFIKGSLIGYDIPLLGHYRVGIGAGISGMVVGYALGLVQVYVLAWIVDALAPTFGGQKNIVQALKSVAFAFTAAWVAGLGQVLPWIAALITIAGAFYSFYLLYKGLPHTMHCPPEKSIGYTVVSIIAGVVLSIVIGAVVGALTGVSGPRGQVSSTGAIQFDKDSPLAKIDGYAKRLDTASKNFEAAQQSGDAKAQQEALGKVVGAALGGGSVTALDPQQLEAFIPQSLGKLPRTDMSAERNAAMGLEISEAHATFANATGKTLQLDITDMAAAKGVMGLASMVSPESESQSSDGFEKTYQSNGRLVHEQWDNGDGEYSIVVGGRFTVKVSGNVESIDTLKSAANQIDLDRLEALKEQGAKDS